MPNFVQIGQSVAKILSRTALEVVDVITCEKNFSDRFCGESNVQGSHRLSQWLLTQGWRNCAACDRVIMQNFVEFGQTVADI